MSRESYFEDTSISRSVLWKLAKHPLFAKAMLEGEIEEETSEALILGDAFDTMMFDNEKVLTERFHIMSVDNPYTNGRTNLGKFTTEVSNELQIMMKDNTIINLDKTYDYVYQKCGIKTPKLDKFKKDFVKGGGETYLRELINAKGKIILSQDQLNQLSAMKVTLLNSPFKQYFRNEIPEGANRFAINDLNEVIYQQEIYFAGHKAMLDVVHIDHETRKITGIDLKTTSAGHGDIESSVIKYGYNLQAAMYTHALRYLVAKGQEFEGYTINPHFMFIFVNKKGDYAPISYTMTEHDMFRAMNGGYIRGKYHRGILELMEDLKWHRATDNWEYPKKVYENGTILSNIYDPVS